MTRFSTEDVSVYEWCVNVDDYEWMEWLREDYGKADEPFAKSRAFGASWKGRVLIRCKNAGKSDRPVSDTPQGLSALRLLSRRALDVLRDLVEPTCEVLPLDSEVGEFWAINCLVKADCIDEANSTRYEYNDGSKGRLLKWVFDPARLPRAHVFRIPEDCTNFLVSQAFVDRVKETRLLGFRLNLLWSQSGGPIERQDFFRGAIKDAAEEWEKKEIRRMKSEIRRQRKEALDKKKSLEQRGQPPQPFG